MYFLISFIDFVNDFPIMQMNFPWPRSLIIGFMPQLFSINTGFTVFYILFIPRTVRGIPKYLAIAEMDYPALLTPFIWRIPANELA